MPHSSARYFLSPWQQTPRRGWRCICICLGGQDLWSHPPAAPAPHCLSANHLSRCLTLMTCLQSAGPEVYEPFIMASVVNPNLWLFQNKSDWKGRAKPLLSYRNQQLVMDGERLLRSLEEPRDPFSAVVYHAWSSLWLKCSLLPQASRSPRAARAKALCHLAAARQLAERRGTPSSVLYRLALLSQDESIEVAHEKSKIQTWHIIWNLSFSPHIPPSHPKPLFVQGDIEMLFTAVLERCLL